MTADEWRGQRRGLREQGQQRSELPEGVRVHVRVDVGDVLSARGWPGRRREVEVASGLIKAATMLQGAEDS
jgi:hypothetical protein